MLNLEFPGSDTLVAELDAAVDRDSVPAITDALRNTLCRLMRGGDVRLPECVNQPFSDHYARREIYHSERHGYCVVAMTWGPGQGTPIHDHAGMWCVEGVWRGQLEVTQYQLLEHERERYHFRPVGAMQAGTGSAGSLIPPHEFHAIRNPSEDAIAVSLHIYSGRMTCCSVFQDLGENWYQRDQRELGLDRMH